MEARLRLDEHGSSNTSRNNGPLSAQGTARPAAAEGVHEEEKNSARASCRED